MAHNETQFDRAATHYIHIQEVLGSNIGVTEDFHGLPQPFQEFSELVALPFSFRSLIIRYSDSIANNPSLQKTKAT
jgi:hypothetical protein